MMAHKIVAYLISMAVGYWVLTLAAREKNDLQKIGKAIGWIIIVVSFFGPLCAVGSALVCHLRSSSCSYSSGSSCAWQGGAMHCPDSAMGMPETSKGQGADKPEKK